MQFSSEIDQLLALADQQRRGVDPATTDPQIKMALADFEATRRVLDDLLDDRLQKTLDEDAVRLRDEVTRQGRTAQFVVVSLLAAGIVLGIAVSIATARTVLAPVGQLVTATKAVARGDWRARVTIERRDEFGHLGHSFNQMIAARKQAEDELAQACAELDKTRLQQLRTKDQLLSHVSHELRTPLTAAYQFIEILRDGVAGELTPEQQEYSDIALRNLKQLRTLIGDLLDATRIESAKLSIVPGRMRIADVIHDVCRSLLSPVSEKQIALDVDPGNTPDAFADPNRVRQVLTNLLQNAVKFTSAGGRITVRAAADGPDMVCVTVSDTGRGIAPASMSRLFSRLYQVESRDDERRGLGLGLYICKELVTRQGGTIGATSELGKGSTFSFTLPRFVDEADAARTA